MPETCRSPCRSARSCCGKASHQNSGLQGQRHVHFNLESLVRLCGKGRALPCAVLLSSYFRFLCYGSASRFMSLAFIQRYAKMATGGLQANQLDSIMGFSAVRRLPGLVRQAADYATKPDVRLICKPHVCICAGENSSAKCCQHQKGLGSLGHTSTSVVVVVLATVAVHLFPSSTVVRIV